MNIYAPDLFVFIYILKSPLTGDFPISNLVMSRAVFSIYHFGGSSFGDPK